MDRLYYPVFLEQGEGREGGSDRWRERRDGREGRLLVMLKIKKARNVRQGPLENAVRSMLY